MACPTLLTVSPRPPPEVHILRPKDFPLQLSLRSTKRPMGMLDMQTRSPCWTDIAMTSYDKEPWRHIAQIDPNNGLWPWVTDSRKLQISNDMWPHISYMWLASQHKSWVERNRDNLYFAIILLVLVCLISHHADSHQVSHPQKFLSTTSSSLRKSLDGVRVARLHGSADAAKPELGPLEVDLEETSPPKLPRQGTCMHPHAPAIDSVSIYIYILYIYIYSYNMYPPPHPMKWNHMDSISGDTIDAFQLDHLPLLWMWFGPFGLCAVVVHG